MPQDRPRATLAAALLCLACGGLIVSSKGAGPLAASDDPLALVRAYFSAPNPDERAALAARLAAHRDYRPSRLRDWLHRGVPFSEQKSGSDSFVVDVGGVARRVFLLVPDRYRPNLAWPLIYALHPSGQTAEQWGRVVQRSLGEMAHDFLIASPEFRQNYIGARPPFVPEHAAILDAVFRRVHVAADRVYPLGYSMGGFGAWFVALYYPDRVAGAVAMASGFDVAPADDGFWKVLVPNVMHVPILNVWGALDDHTARLLDGTRGATFAEANRRFQRELRGMDLPIVNVEILGGEHNDLDPPPEAFAEILAARRADDPKRVHHTFRHLHEASCYWLEGLSWVGDAWGDPRPPLVAARAGESEAQTIARTLEPLLGQLTGVIDGQTIRVTRRHIGDLVVWLGDHTVNWDRPVTLEVDGRTVFEGRVSRDAGVALARARATMDFEALRFAGLLVRAGGRVEIITAATMPEPVWRSGMTGGGSPAPPARSP